MKTKKEKKVLTEEEKTANKKKFNLVAWMLCLLFIAVLLGVITIYHF